MARNLPNIYKKSKTGSLQLGINRIPWRRWDCENK